MSAGQNMFRPIVLVVDDDPESILLVQTMVDYCGYECITASNCTEAAEGMARQPAAVVLDVVMPDGCSERLLQRLAEGKSPLPVIVMSAMEEPDLETFAGQARESGVNVVASLAKPFWLEPLINALEQAIPEPAAFASQDQ